MNGQNDKSKIAGSISLIAGIWLVLSAFVMSLGLTSNVFIIGVLLVIFSLIELYSMESTMWVSWVNGVLGLWLLISPFFIMDMTRGEIWNVVILGIIVLGVAIWGGMSTRIGIGHPKAG